MVDSRTGSDGLTVRRRRECAKCHFRFSTVEEIELLDIVVVKSDGRRESYMRSKVEVGIRISLSKCSYTAENFSRLIHAVERDIQKKRKREISSQDIGEIVMRHLHSFNKVAYIRFASVYRDFKDVKTFEKELKKIASSKATK